MMDWAFFIGGIALGGGVGGLVGWLLATGRAARAAAGQVNDLHTRTGAAESAAAELRKSLEERDRETAGLRESLDRERQARTEAQTRLEESVKNIDTQRQSLDEAKRQLRDAFASVAADQLRNNNEIFTRQAEQKIQPLRDALTRFESQIRSMEQARQTAYGGVSSQLESLKQTHERLQKETAGLVAALRQPNVRGRWGEITLRRVVEVAGMCEHCDFDEQAHVSGENGRLRPDMVVNLPRNLKIVVDSKAPLDAYLRAVEAEGDEARRADMTAHARAIRSHVQHLSSKAYAAQIGPSADMVVLFLPGEAFFMAAIEHDRTLIEDALKHSVLLSTPIMLIALLKTIAHSWREQQVADNARRIADEGRAFLNRLCIFAEHLNNVGDGLGKATKAYNRAVGSWQAGVIPGASSLRELGVQSGREDSLNVSTVDEAVRSVVHADAVDDALLLAPADAPSPVREHIIEVPDKGE